MPSIILDNVTPSTVRKHAELIAGILARMAGHENPLQTAEEVAALMGLGRIFTEWLDTATDRDNKHLRLALIDPITNEVVFSRTIGDRPFSPDDDDLDPEYLHDYYVLDGHADADDIGRAIIGFATDFFKRS